MFVCSLQNLKENKNQMNLKFHDCWYYHRSALLLRQSEWATTGGSRSVQWQRREVDWKSQITAVLKAGEVLRHILSQTLHGHE